MIDPVLVVHAAATWSMTGVIWIVQVVVYPLLARIPESDRPGHARAHAARIVPVVGPVMLLELLTGLWLAARPPAGVAPAEAWANAVVLGLIWIVTAAVQLPQHRRLRRGADPGAARALVRGNWVRTVMWTARAAVILRWSLL